MTHNISIPVPRAKIPRDGRAVHRPLPRHKSRPPGAQRAQTFTSGVAAAGPALSLIAASGTAAHATPTDADRDGMLNSWEIKYKLNPRNVKDARADADRDGLSNAAEYVLKLNPRNRKDASLDLDFDGLKNIQEYRPACSGHGQRRDR